MIRDTDGRFVQNDEQAANILRQNYQDMSKLNFSNDNKRFKKVVSNIIRSFRSNIQKASFIFIQELDVAISSLILNKSSGLDGIQAPMIYNLEQIGKQMFLDIINDSWTRGWLPREWRKAIIITVKDPSKKSTSPESYRPIALTCISCKIMEKMILKRLTYFLNIKNLLSQEQYGFREGHYTTDKVLCFCQKIRDAHSRRLTHHTAAVFLDLSKAFDRVWNQNLIIKLVYVFRIRERALN